MRGLSLVAAALLTAVIGCSGDAAPPNATAKKLPIVVLRYGYQPDRTEYLEGPYGFLIRWNDDEPPRFYVYDATRWRIDATGDFDEFLRLLSAFPEGAKVRWITTCCAPSHFAMPEKNREEIATLKAAKRWSYPGEEDFVGDIFCTCESREIVFLEKAP